MKIYVMDVDLSLMLCVCVHVCIRYKLNTIPVTNNYIQNLNNIN